jgi:hypothetical protein
MGIYDDMIHLSRPISTAHPSLPMEKRAAQFAPFAALTGYEEATKETARLTQGRVELEEDEKAALNAVLLRLLDLLPQRPKASFTYFRPDQRKAGGAYVTTTGQVKKLDRFRRLITLTDGSQIPIDQLIHAELIESDEDE